MLPKGNDQGVLVTQGGMSGGFALLLEKGRPAFYYNMANVAHYSVASERALKPGIPSSSTSSMTEAASARAAPERPASTASRWPRGGSRRPFPSVSPSDETFDIGEDTGTPVDLSYDVPFKFTGRIEKLVINLGQTKLGAADQQRLRGAEANPCSGLNPLQEKE